MDWEAEQDVLARSLIHSKTLRIAVNSIYGQQAPLYPFDPMLERWQERMRKLAEQRKMTEERCVQSIVLRAIEMTNAVA